MNDASKAGVIVIGLIVISEQAACVDEMVAEQEVKGLLCEDVPVCSHPGEEAPDHVFGGEVLRHAYTKVVQGVVVPIENGFKPPGVLSDVFETQVNVSHVSPPSLQDPLER